MHNPKLQINLAREQDRQRLVNLIQHERYVHRHLDWRMPLDWLGSPHFWVAGCEEKIVAALACPPDPIGIAWVRLFACSGNLSIKDTWDVLWPQAWEQFHSTNTLFAAISIQGWVETLLRESGFERHQEIVMLELAETGLMAARNVPGVILRPMRVDDLPRVASVDALAFHPLWQNSLPALEVAFQMAGYCTVTEVSGKIVGYQISTVTPFGAHLARLAVCPEYQGQGIGGLLVDDLSREMALRGVTRITVNTQGDNQSSLTLYHSKGFFETGERYPVYIFSIKTEER